MRVLVPEIATHVMEGGEGRNQEVLSVDVHPTEAVLVSAGAGENRVIVWAVDPEAERQESWLSFSCEFTSLSFDNTVNILRFSPCGRYLACGDSNGLVTLLSVKNDRRWADVKDERDFLKVHLRGHMMDVQDFAWAPSSNMGASVAMDNLVIVWDTIKCVELQRVKDHTHFAQGVAWSPDGHFIASASFDETVRVYKTSSKAQKFSLEEVSVLKKPRLFADEFKAPTFSRRLAFSPEAWSRILVVPGGLTRTANAQSDANNANDEVQVLDSNKQETAASESSTKAPLQHAVHLFRFTPTTIAETLPCATLTGFQEPAVAVRFHPRPFELKEGTESCLEVISQPSKTLKRFVYAVATVGSLLVYDTQHPYPIALTDKLHYASYTDAAWFISDNGTSLLVACSRDGCFTLIRFNKDELGQMEERAIVAPSAPELSTVTTPAPESASSSETPMKAQSVEGNVNQAIVINENSTGSQSASKKRRVALENLSSPSIPTLQVVPQPATSSSTSTSAAEPAICILQPRRKTAA